MSFFSVALERSWYQPNWLTPLLWPFSVVYAVGWMIYKALHPLRRGETVASVPVIVVGNLTVGGTGKTPLVVWLAQALNDAGYRPGIISRGYGGRARQPVEVTAVMDPTVAGDEAVMMAGMTDVPVLVDYDRCRGIKFLYRQCNVNVVISDDGLQNRKLPRWLEVLVIDGERRFGNGLLLPAGPLRESVARMRTVDFIVANGPARNGEIAMATTVKQCVNLVSGELRPLSVMLGQKFLAVTGIGNAQRFFGQLRLAGVSLEERMFPDHHVFCARDFETSEGRDVLMTAKDAVKCRQFAEAGWWQVNLEVSLPVGFADEIVANLPDLDEVA
ncbi:MAG: tetraacyldisaccharide 4'-kinase [Pseudomonadota bacterium]|jgi:tetraacyldisaccharide 4'-kinase|nr:tetraacyldisaccharide 4'-kinase [Pseudomonadota bacterium]